MSAAALPAMSARDLFAPRRAGGTGEGLALAVAAHVLLVLALAWSVNWRASEPEGVVAELWSSLPQQATPRAMAPEPEPVVTPRRVEAPPAPRPLPPPEAPRIDPQIAIERAAKERAAREEAERREAAKLADRREAAEREREKARDKEKARQEALQREKLAEAEQKKKDLEKQRQDDARTATIREANLKRMMAQAGGSSDSTSPSTGRAAQTSGPSAGYAGRIKARIKPNIVLTGSVDGNPTAEIEVRVAPDGTIVGRRITKSSGSAVWDETVLRAIDKTEILPKDIDGRVQPVIPMTFRPIE